MLNDEIYLKIGVILIEENEGDLLEMVWSYTNAVCVESWAIKKHVHKMK